MNLTHKVLMVSGDPNILQETSSARKRMEEYAGLFDELHIVVMVPRRAAFLHQQNLLLHPVYARSAFLGRCALYKKARELCRTHRFDVITVQSPDEIGIIGLLLKWQFGVPLQVQMHSDILSPWYKKSSWKEGLRFQLARFVLPRASCIRVVSERIKKSLFESRLLSSSIPITVLPIFTDLERFQETTADQSVQTRFGKYQFKMVAAGRFVDKEKNFSMLILMMRDFVKICPNVLLVLVGSGPDEDRHRREIALYTLEKNVIIEPWREDLPGFFKAFDLFLLSSNHESWGRVALEAMASGLPIIMTDVGLAGEVVRNGENGVVVSVNNPNAFFEACVHLYRNPEKRRELAKAGLETVKNLKPKTVEEYLRIYEKSFKSCGKN